VRFGSADSERVQGARRPARVVVALGRWRSWRLVAAATIAAVAIAAGTAGIEPTAGAASARASDYRLAAGVPVPAAGAERFLDSVGVVTHLAYFDTTYARWAELVERLRELGVRHLRDEAYANPSPSWDGWNARYRTAVARARRAGMRFLFILGKPGMNPGGGARQLIAAVAGPLRAATEAVEAPNELDHFDGTRGWQNRLYRYTLELARRKRAHSALARVPLVGPSFARWESPSTVGALSRHVDICNIHPYPGGRVPTPARIALEIARMRPVCGGVRRVWATEAGYHNALAARGESQPPVSEEQAAAFLPALLLDHFRSGIERTYIYELVDQLPDPGQRDPELHYGLLRSDLSRKPAFVAVRNLLRTVARAARARSLPVRKAAIRADPGVRALLIVPRGRGRSLLALWRSAPYDPRAVSTVTVQLQGASGTASVVDPRESTTGRPVATRDGRLVVEVGDHPLLVVAPGAGG